jgi:uncharacterized protein with FMN-binding domain
MLRASLTTGGTVAGIVLMLFIKPHQAPKAVASSVTQSAAPAPSASASPSTSASGSASGSASPSASASTPASTATRKITGDTIDTKFGPVQVAVTVQGSRITKVEVLQVPEENHRDQEINSFAVPELIDETMTAQNAQIDVVSGATYTSNGYVTSLQSALDRAGA